MVRPHIYRCVADSRRARFEAEALRYLDELFRVARRALGDTAAAEDVVQDSYLRAWQSFDRFEPGTNCRAWLYTILFRTMGARRRELQRELTLYDDLAAEATHGGTPAPAGAFAAHQIEKAFAELPIAFATVMHLVDVEGLSYREAAAALEVPVGTVMSRLHRARRQLRQALAPRPSLVKGGREES